jgi:hypothetical protein
MHPRHRDVHKRVCDPNKVAQNAKQRLSVFNSLARVYLRATVILSARSPGPAGKAMRLASFTHQKRRLSSGGVLERRLGPTVLPFTTARRSSGSSSDHRSACDANSPHCRHGPGLCVHGVCSDRSRMGCCVCICVSCAFDSSVRGHPPNWVPSFRITCPHTNEHSGDSQ